MRNWYWVAALLMEELTRYLGKSGVKGNGRWLEGCEPGSEGRWKGDSPCDSLNGLIVCSAEGYG